MATLDDRMNTIEAVQQYHETRISLLESILERVEANLQETRRDVQQTKRIWVSMARKFGWGRASAG